MDPITCTNCTKHQRLPENTCQLTATVIGWLCDLGFIGCGFLIAPSWSPWRIAHVSLGEDLTHTGRDKDALLQKELQNQSLPLLTLPNFHKTCNDKYYSEKV